MQRTSFLCILGAALCVTIACGQTNVTFNRDVAPILFNKCASCHRPGEGVSFDLLTYEDARNRASQIVEVTQNRFMPPWPPKEGYGAFAGARRLSDEEIQTLAEWVSSGTRRGGDADLPDAPTFVDGWHLGPPDFVLESPPYKIAASGNDQFRNFVIPVELDSARWVEAVELRPSNPRVTHHARLGVDSTRESARRDAEDDQPGYDGLAWGKDPEGQLVAWVPGMVAGRNTPGTAWRLQPKTYLVLHSHLHPSGKPEEVHFRIGIHFADKSPTAWPVILRIGSRDIDIPAGETHHVVIDRYELPVDVDVRSIFPHAHSLCTGIHVRAELPDGSEQPLIWIEPFDESWHDTYHYAAPVRLPRGATIVTEYVYDNSDENPHNRHHPPVRTVYGSNTDDEMQDVYLQVTAAQPDQRAVLAEDFEQYEQRSKLVGYRKTLEKYPQDPWSREGLAACYIGLEKPADAIRMLEARLLLGTNDVHAVAALGMAYFAAGDYAQTEKLERRATALDVDYPLAWLGLGKALGAQQKFEEAERSYRRAVELAPALTDAHVDRAAMLLHLGRLDEAAAACEAAITISPDMPGPHLKLAEIRTRQKQFAEALRILGEAQRTAPYIHPPKVLLAVYCYQNGETDRAHKLLAEARAEQPDHPVPMLFLGQLAGKEQHPEDARRYLDAAAALALPENWPASHRKRFLILLHSERYQLARQLQDEALARAALADWVNCDPENEKVGKLYDQFLSAAPATGSAPEDRP